MTDAEIIEVVQAHKEGRKIQAKRAFSDCDWYDVHLFSWNFEMFAYRVAPEPRKPIELTLVYKGNGTWKEWMSEPGPCLEKAIHVREVVDNSEDIKKAFRKAMDCL